LTARAWPALSQQSGREGGSCPTRSRERTSCATKALAPKDGGTKSTYLPEFPAMTTLDDNLFWGAPGDPGPNFYRCESLAPMNQLV
jgi:hypothetical protein